MKTCSNCGETKDSREFYEQKSAKDKLQSKCKICAKAYTRARYIEKREDILASAATRYLKNHDREIARSADYRTRNRDKINAQVRAYYWAHCEERKAYSKAYNAAHREERQIYMTDWRVKHIAEEKEYRQTPAGRYFIYKNRAKKYNRVFNLNLQQFTDLTSRRCIYCGIVGNKGHSGLDRVQNEQGYSVDNCVPSCWPCNNCKRGQSLEQFLLSPYYIKVSTALLERSAF